MEFQNQPFQDLKERVAVLERQVEELQELIAKTLLPGVAHSLTIRGIKNPIRFTGGGTKPSALCKKQDDAGGESILTTVEEIPQEDEKRS